ncbi:hypothetical protein AAE021_14020 [Arthrobacter citreus]|uniref:Uncharacterized protein n=1 Tax=Arthrobacter citreus TaxID=1670 RepID=A0ABZ2ZSY0_9MICC
MKFNLTAHSTPTNGTAAQAGTADGTFVVMPEAVMAILNEAQTTAAEFNRLFAAAEANIINLADVCKAPPITTELSTYSSFMLKRTIRTAGGRITVAVDAVANAVLALIQGDGQMSDTAREAAALAAQDHVDEAPGAAGRSRYAGRGPAQAF